MQLPNLSSEYVMPFGAMTWLPFVLSSWVELLNLYRATRPQSIPVGRLPTVVVAVAVQPEASVTVTE